MLLDRGAADFVGGRLTCSVLPTAVLSTHPSGFTGYTYRDLTVDILPMAEHWKTEGLSFDAVYSGFLGSCEQLESVQRIFQLFGQKETICLVDPVMGDNGKLYQMYTEDMVEGMRGLCRSATILTPNLTEAAFLTGIPYQAECYSEEYIQSLVKGLAALGAPQIVLTGISFDETQIGAALSGLRAIAAICLGDQSTGIFSRNRRHIQRGATGRPAQRSKPGDGRTDGSILYQPLHPAHSGSPGAGTGGPVF